MKNILPIILVIAFAAAVPADILVLKGERTPSVSTDSQNSTRPTRTMP